MWDTSILPITQEKRSFCYSIVKTDQNRFGMLKMASFTLNYLYPNGPKGVVKISVLTHAKKPAQQKRGDEFNLEDMLRFPVITIFVRELQICICHQLMHK
jgi:hypothetical protein